MPPYNLIRIQTFLAQKVDLQDFCFWLENKVRPVYAYKSLAGNIPAARSISLVEAAAINDEVGELVFQLVTYWLDRIHGSPHVITRSGLHEDSALFHSELLKEGNQTGKAAEVLALLKRIMPETPSYVLAPPQAPAGPIRLLSVQAFHQILDTRFDDEELRTLCFYLEVDYDNLGGVGKSAKARELVMYLERHGQLPQLAKAILQLRPDVIWD
jgi:hypothetical protein